MTVLLFVLGCAGAYDGAAPSGEGAAVYGKVVSLLGAGLGDVEVCAPDHDVACVMSQGDGDFLLEPLPEAADLVVTMAKEDHLRTAYLHNTTVAQEWRKTLMPDSIVDSMTNRVDVEQEAGKGHILFILWSGPDYDAYDRVEGVSFSLDVAAASFYQAPGGLPDPELTATSSSGSGGAFNVEPGPHLVTFSGGGVTCEPWFSYDFAPGDPVPVTVLPGWGSYMDLVCR